MPTQYDKISPWFDKHRSRELFEKPYLDMVAKALPENGNILDLGCGIGEPIAQYFINLGFNITGVDNSIELINLARERFPKASFICTDMTKVDFDEKFDCIIAWHSYFHLTREQQKNMFHTFAKHIQPGGLLLFTTGVENGEVWSNNGGEDLYHSSLSKKEYYDLAHHHGFSVIKHQESDPDCGHATVWLLQKTRNF